MFYLQRAILLLICVFLTTMLKAQSSASAMISANIMISDDQPVIENISVNNSAIQKKNSTELTIASVSISGNNYIYAITTPAFLTIKSNQNEEKLSLYLSNNNGYSETALKEWFLSARTKIPIPAGNYFSTSAVEVIINYN